MLTPEALPAGPGASGWPVRGPRRHLIRQASLATLAACIVCGLISVHLKQDANWDLQNYHLYTPFSLLNGRLSTDLWAGHLQITFNPLLDLPYYIVARLWLPDCPRCVAFLAGLPFGLLVPLSMAINWLVLPTRPGRLRVAAAALASLVGLTGSTVVAEIGTTFGDIPIALLVLAGLLCVIATIHIPPRWTAGCAAAGVCLGAAAGLKLTAVIYAPALGACVLLCAPRQHRLTGAVAFSCGWAAAFLPPVLWWGMRLMHVFGSPVFPMLNDVFHSPWAAGASTLDVRFLPRDIWQALFYPFFWISGRPFVVIEGSLRDPRFAAAYLSLAWLAARALHRKTPLASRSWLLVIFFAAAFAVWETLFSILRYALPLEILTGTCITLALVSLLEAARLDAKRGLAALAFLLACTLALQKNNDTGRLKRYGATVFDITAPALPNGAAVVVTGHPLSFVVPFLQGTDLVFVGLAQPPPTPLVAAAVRARLQAASAVFTLGNAGNSAGVSALAAFGWRIDTTGCAPVRTKFQAGIMLCPATRTLPKG